METIVEEDRGVFWVDYPVDLSEDFADSCFRYLFEALFYDSENCFWLDDARPLQNRRRSAIGSGPSVSLRSGSCLDPTDVESFFSKLLDCDPQPWPLGFVGWIDYEVGACLLGVNYPTQQDAPATGQTNLSSWICCNRAICIDYRMGLLKIISFSKNTVDAKEWVNRASTLVEKLLMKGSIDREDYIPQAKSRHLANSKLMPRNSFASGLQWLHTDQQYLQLIHRVLEKIMRGDVYQICLANRLTIRNSGNRSPFSAFWALRQKSPTQYCAYIKIGPRHFVSSSPELFLALSDNILVTEPIKGTRPRGRSPSEDSYLISELKTSEKEKAENLMIVDLMRNDFSKICSSVEVDYMYRVRTYKGLHQLVSRVSGILRPGRGFFDILCATFPAGSVTGAPKIAAVKSIYDLERARRGVYSGAFGYISGDGKNICFAMSIRSAVFCNGEVSIGSGGGVVFDSDPEFELAETKLKVAAMIDAILGR
ncbi:anthranilate synthase component I family protein [Tropheryma whipplei]|uniref:Anthranilate synthase component I n=1 Tax=Tropheryma whipplei (strain Twist) TaxID=203267 RepID=Q83GC5_TROWT|nr:anthranilate synthase component I family protein [Tropheryma whipplei]AAO44483.1 anthranilate synthase component I [Tropheryma whipplei str. Twist]MCO8190123.1 anthranilate synthase component I family protein [Tropheryma whipplei]